MKTVCVLALLGILCSGPIGIADARAAQGQNVFLLQGLPSGLQGDFSGISGHLSGNTQQNEALEKLKQQCFAIGGQSAVNEIDQSAKKMQTCVAEVMPNIRTISDKSPGGICKFMHQTIHTCMHDFTKKMEHCMDNRTMYAPGFSTEVLDSVFKFLCKDDAKQITTLMTSMSRPDECVQKLKASMPDCATRMTSIKTDNVNSLVYGGGMSKTELCSNMTILKDCMIEKANTYCSGNMNTFVTGIAKAVYAPCSGCTLFMANIFSLIFLVVFTKLF